VTYTHPSLTSLSTAVLALALVGASSVSAAPAPAFEQPPVMQASKVLPQQLRQSANYKVQERVVTDGFMYMYQVDSAWGPLQVTSNALLEQYLHELDVVAQLEGVKGSSEFAGAMKDVGADVVGGAATLIRNPIDTMGGAVSGVGAMFGRANEALVSGGVKGDQDSALAEIAGYTKLKREYAHEFGVDVYSRNPILQSQLDAVSRAAFAGNVTAKVAFMAVPGGAGAVVSVAKNTRTLNEALRDLPPLELRKRNRGLLEAMKVDPELADLFVESPVFTPREQSVVVEALLSMASTRNRDAFVRQAILTSDADSAFFRQRQAEMYANYHRSRSLARFVSVGQVAVGQREDGHLVFCAPLDVLYWTPRMAEFLEVFESQLGGMGEVKGKELVLGGSITPMARSELTKRGWSVTGAP